MRRLTALIAASCMTLAGLVTAASPAAAAPQGASPPGIDWGPCTDAALAGQAECGYLTVPLDYQHPNGATIKLAVSRVKHTVPESQYQGVMLVNPGGPGGSGLDLATLGAAVPNNAGDAYDWIGFDPRGVGASKPALSCIPDYFHGDRPPYTPTTPGLLQTWLARSKAYAQACGRNGGALLAHMKTTDSARDMDRIRAALGASKINYYGFSYGTYLGQVYTTLFPERVRRMVLDSNVDPRHVWYEANLRQDIAFERNMQVWFSWVAKYDNVYHLGTTAAAVERLFYQQLAALRAHPAGGVLGPDEWIDAFTLVAYVQVLWPDLAQAFSAWVHQRDASTVIAAYRSFDAPGNDNTFAVYNAVQCTDAPSPTHWSTWAKDSWRISRIAPFLTWSNTWFNAPCLFWPAKPGTPVKVDGDAVRALLIDETLDAATPYEGSLVVRQLFPKSSLIALPGGTTHAGSLFGNTCLDSKIASYLATGALPPRRPGNHADAYCQPLPPPVPAASTASKVSSSAGAIRALPAG